MIIEVKFRDDEARSIKRYLCKRYGKNNNISLNTLVKMLIRETAANEAMKELQEQS